MANPVKRKIKVLQADYVADADSILILGECSDGRIRQQIHSSAFSFGGKDKEAEMKKTAEMMIGKEIVMVFDPDLEDKIEDKTSLKYD